MTSSKIILLCGAGYVSGKEIVALELAKGLMSRGLPLHVVSSSWNDGDFVRRLSDAGIDYELMPVGFISTKLSLDCLRMTGEQLLRWPQLVWAYRRMLARERPSAVIHTNWHHILLLRPLLRPHRDCFWLHECVPNSPRYRRAYSRLAKRLRMFICVSHAVAQSLIALGVPADKVRVVHNGISDPSANFAVNAAPSKPTINLGIVGQVGLWKGHTDLISAFALVSRDHANLRLHIFGTGKHPFVDELQQLARDLQIECKIEWHGFVKDRTAIYSRLNVCVVPSRFEEPFGLSAVEPAFFGIPVIATRRGGLPEIVVDNETGFLVDAENPEQLSAAIARLVADPQLRKRMSAAARARATTHFSQYRFINDFLHAIEITPPQPVTESLVFAAASAHP